MYETTTDCQRVLSTQPIAGRAKSAGSVWWCAVVVAALLLSGCGGKSNSNPNQAVEDKQLAEERERLGKEKQAEREAAERELIARNLPSATPSEKLWKQFRQTFPHHSQVLAL